jgi:hypothetical protein
MDPDLNMGTEDSVISQNRMLLNVSSALILDCYASPVHHTRVTNPLDEKAPYSQPIPVLKCQ